MQVFFHTKPLYKKPLVKTAKQTKRQYSKPKISKTKTSNFFKTFFNFTNNVYI